MFIKFNLFLMLILSTSITISSESWFNAWLGMEINLMAFIPIMLNNNKKNFISNSMMTYFIIQASASSILIMAIIMMKMYMNLIKLNVFITIIQISILMKLGASPFHWWMPKIINNLSWMNCFIFLTWQKIAPMTLLMYLNSNSLIYLSSLMSSMIGAMLGMNQTVLKLLITYSSINHMGWMLMILMFNMNLLWMYFSIYFIINFIICLMFNKFNICYMNQLFKISNQNIFMKMLMMSSFFSLAGLPPMIGFIPKMLTLTMMIKNNLITETVLFIFTSILSLSYYLNPLMSIMLISKMSIKWDNKFMKIYSSIFIIITINMTLMFFFVNLIDLNLFY